MSSEPSLCIPWVFTNISQDKIRKTIEDLNIGKIRRIDTITKLNSLGEKSKRIFIHFKEWYKNDNAVKARERLLEGKEIKIIYDEPWFWKVSANRSNKTLNYIDDK